MASLEKDLEQYLEGEVRVDHLSRAIYSVDASIYEIIPEGVVLPKSKQDVLNAVLVARKHGLPVTARGAATGITGGCLGKGLIVDTSKHMNRILDIDLENETVICEPGVIQDQLNDALAKHGYRLGPDTSTGNRATIGGMLGNNAAGARSLRYGKMIDHVEEVQLVLANGDILRFGWVDEATREEKEAQDDAEGHIYREIRRISTAYREEIERKFPKIPRRVAGYNLDELIKPGPVNLAKLIVGSEGSLGIATKIKLRIVPRPKTTGIVVIHFTDLIEGLRHVPYLLEQGPLSLELIDDQIIKMGRIAPSMKGRLEWLEEEPSAIFVFEFDDADPEALVERLDTVVASLKAKNIGYAHKVLTDPTTMGYVWQLRKAGLGLLLSRRSYSKAIAFVEDVAAPPEKMAEFIERFQACLEKSDKKAGIYGHIGAGCVHIRPYIDLKKEEELELMTHMMEEVGDILLDCGGTLSGEHGDGYVRSWMNEKMFGSKLYQAFKELKAAFDPDGIMNPGKVIANQGLTENLRIDPSTKQAEIETVLDFRRENGFTFAVEMCNGNSQCRKPSGTMCPSFHVTGDERHSTRARAQSLRSIINGRTPIEMFTSKDLYEVMDLCVECKGCKTECPSQVDMAKMKAEFLHHYQQKHGYTLRSRLFAHIGSFNRFASPLADLSNWLNDTKIARWALTRLGVAPERSLPQLAPQRFTTWWNKQQRDTSNSPKQVVLFVDTFTEFNYPHLGRSAVDVLHALGYEIIVPPWTCCGRTLISKGFLTQAKRKAEILVDTLYPLARQGIPIVGIEPSCLLTIRDEVRDLVSGAKVRQVVDHCLTVDEFLAEEDLSELFAEQTGQVRIHGHCHQKSLVGMEPSLRVLRTIPGLEASAIDSGCCGMAGSFGYEKEHYKFSIDIGETQLFPAVRSCSPETRLIANGVSCRNQIADGTGRSAQHLIEFVACCMNR